MSLKKPFISFKSKLILSIVFVCVFFGGVTIGGYQYSISRLHMLLYQQTAISLNSISMELSLDINRIVNMSQQAALDSSIQSYLLQIEAADNPSDKLSARNGITNDLYSYLGTDIISLTILTNQDDTPIICGLNSTPESSAMIQKIIGICEQRQGAETWMLSGQTDGSILCVREIKKAESPDFLTTLGYLIVRVNISNMVQNAVPANYLDDSNLLTIVDTTGALIYPKQANFQINYNHQMNYEILQINSKTYFVTQMQIDASEPMWDITIGIEYGNIFGPVISTELITLVLIAAGIIISITFASVTVKNINRRFQLLVVKMNRLKSGNFEVVSSKKPIGHDELGLLNQYFDDMTLELKNMVNENYVKQMLIIQARFRLLEQQINPHFLYNTLDSINWFAKNSGEEHIPVIVEALGSFLRNILNESGDIISLGQELEILNDYLQIQQIRYTDMLHVLIDVDDSLLNIKIPRLTLQPLVENAIRYSMEDSIDGCRIEIRARAVENDVLITIENNDSEIDPEILRKLRNKEVKASGHGIGLLNIDERIKIAFGDEYGLRFENQPDKAIVKLLIPNQRMDEVS